MQRIAGADLVEDLEAALAKFSALVESLADLDDGAGVDD
jgi:hypothetical protein